MKEWHQNFIFYSCQLSYAIYSKEQRSCTLWIKFFSWNDITSPYDSPICPNILRSVSCYSLSTSFSWKLCDKCGKIHPEACFSFYILVYCSGNLSCITMRFLTKSSKVVMKPFIKIGKGRIRESHRWTISF